MRCSKSNEGDITPMAAEISFPIMTNVDDYRCLALSSYKYSDSKPPSTVFEIVSVISNFRLPETLFFISMTAG